MGFREVPVQTQGLHTSGGGEGAPLDPAEGASLLPEHPVSLLLTATPGRSRPDLEQQLHNGVPGTLVYPLL